MTLKSFSELSGISQPNLSNYINGNVSPTLETLQRIAKALDLRVQDLFTGEPTNAPASASTDAPADPAVEIYAKVNGKSYRITERDILDMIKAKAQQSNDL